MQFPLIHESCSLTEIRSPPHHKRQECKVTCLADWRCVLWVPGEKFWRSWYESQVYCNAAGYVAFSHLFPRFSPDFLHQMTIIRSISWSPFAVQVQFNWLQELCSLCCDLVKNGINPHPFTHEKRGDRYQVLALKQCMLVGHIFFIPMPGLGWEPPVTLTVLILLGRQNKESDMKWEWFSRHLVRRNWIWRTVDYSWFRWHIPGSKHGTLPLLCGWWWAAGSSTTQCNSAFISDVQAGSWLRSMAGAVFDSFCLCSKIYR